MQNKLLIKLGIGEMGRTAAVLYMVFSPAFIYTAFIEWSEILTYPFVLAVIFSCVQGWTCIFKSDKAPRRCFFIGIILAFSLLGLTMIKAVSEAVAVFLLIPWGIAAWKLRKSITKQWAMPLAFLAGFLLVYWGGINAYKWMNWHFNDQYVLTNRGSWALYGNTARRLSPLTLRHWQAAVLSVPSNGRECNSFLKGPECQYWTYQVSDGLGETKRKELEAEGWTEEGVNKVLNRMSIELMMAHPFQQAALMILEACKFIFWEYNAYLEYASFPSWLAALYDIPVLYNVLHYGMALLTVLALCYGSFWVVRNRWKLFAPETKEFEATAVMFFSLFFCALWVFFYSFFYCSGRYAMPIAPLWMAFICVFLKANFPGKARK